MNSLVIRRIRDIEITKHPLSLRGKANETADKGTRIKFITADGIVEAYLYLEPSLSQEEKTRLDKLISGESE